MIHIQEGLPLNDLNRRGLLLVMGEPHSEAEAEFNRWYDEEHLKERIDAQVLLVPAASARSRARHDI